LNGDRDRVRVVLRPISRGIIQRTTYSVVPSRTVPRRLVSRQTAIPQYARVSSDAWDPASCLEVKRQISAQRDRAPGLFLETRSSNMDMSPSNFHLQQAASVGPFQLQPQSLTTQDVL